MKLGLSVTASIGWMLDGMVQKVPFAGISEFCGGDE